MRVRPRGSTNTTAPETMHHRRVERGEVVVANHGRRRICRHGSGRKCTKCHSGSQSGTGPFATRTGPVALRFTKKAKTDTPDTSRWSAVRCGKQERSIRPAAMVTGAGGNNNGPHQLLCKQKVGFSFQPAPVPVPVRKAFLHKPR